MNIQINMLRIILILVCSFGLSNSNAQSAQWNIQKGYVAQGYDVVSYFDNKAQKGKDDIIVEHESVKFKFASQENKAKFEAQPEKYLPQYGGYCAYAIGKNGEKVTINPKTYEIRDGKLYLFYNKLFTNTLDKWLEEGAEELKTKADANWENIKKK